MLRLTPKSVPGRWAALAVSHPREALDRIGIKIQGRQDREERAHGSAAQPAGAAYGLDPTWEEQFHGALAADWPCDHRNGRGTLWSVDLPPLREPWFSESRTAVPRELWDGWNYVRGSSQRVLPGVVAEVGQIDIFLHDSLHTYRHMSFELDLAKRSLSPTGVIVADDVNQNQAFAETLQGDRDWDAFTARHESKRGAIGVAWRRQAASSGP